MMKQPRCFSLFGLIQVTCAFLLGFYFYSGTTFLVTKLETYSAIPDINLVSRSQEDGFKRVVYKTKNRLFANRRFLINNRELCSKHAILTAFIFVQMSVGDFEGRTYVRNRWLNPNLFVEPHMASAFFVGLPQNDSVQERLNIEAGIYGDIIQGDFIDTYRNISVKNAAALEWIASYCTNADHIIKTDSDVFINIVQIIDYLEKNPVSPRKFKCRKVRHASIKRLLLPNATYPYNRSPPYCSGPFYIHRGSLIQEYLKTAMETPHTLWSQDVFMTGVVREAMENVTITSGWNTNKLDAHQQYLNCGARITNYVIHRNDHKFHADFHVAWAAALLRLPKELQQKVNETVLEEARTIFPGCKQ